LVVTAPDSPKAAEVFTGIEAETGGISERTDRVASVTCPVCLGCILDENKVVLFANSPQGGQVSSESVQMYWKYCFGAGVMAASTSLGSRLYEPGSISTNTGRAPV
jgi:predicted transporter